MRISIWAWQALNNLESTDLTKMCLLNISGVQTTRLYIPMLFLFCRDPVVLGLRLQGSMNTINLPNSPPMVMKHSLPVKESLHSCNAYLYIHVYTYTYICTYIYVYTFINWTMKIYCLVLKDLTVSSCLGARIFLKFQKEKTVQTRLCLWEITVILILNFNIAETLTKQKSRVSPMSNMRLQMQVSLSKVCWRNAWPLLYLPVPCFLPVLDNRLTFLFRAESIKLVFQHHQSACWILSLYLLTWKKKIPITFWISSHFNAVQNSQK